MSTSDWMLPKIRCLGKPRGCPVVDENFLRGIVLWSWESTSEDAGKQEIYITHPAPRYLTRRPAESLWIDFEEPLGFIVGFREGGRLLSATDWKVEFDYVWKRMFEQNDGYEIVAQKVTGTNPGRFRPSECYVLATALNNVVTYLSSEM